MVGRGSAAARLAVGKVDAAQQGREFVGRGVLTPERCPQRAGDRIAFARTRDDEAVAGSLVFGCGAGC